MTKAPELKPSQKAVKQYYAALKGFQQQGVDHEGAVRAAFQRLLEDAAKPRGWVVVAELRDRAHGKTIIPDATIRDPNSIARGHWESKDTKDDLETEIAKKIKKGYPTKNIIFEDSQKALLYQNGARAMRAELTDPRQLCDLVNSFFAYLEPRLEDFEKAVEEFKERVPELAQGLNEKIKQMNSGDTILNS